MNIPDLAGELHGLLAWGLLPLATLIAATGSTRPELPRGWRRLLALASACGAAAVGLLAARHGMNHLHAPWWVVLLTPPICIVWAYGASESKLMLLLLGAAFLVSFMLWVLLALRALGGTTAVLLFHDALLVLAGPLLLAGLWKQFITPTPIPEQAPPAPPAPEPTAQAAKRDAALQHRLSSAEAQEAADKYTRD